MNSTESLKEKISRTEHIYFNIFHLEESFLRSEEEEENFTENLFLDHFVIFQALDLLSLHFCKHLVDQKYP